MKKNNFFKKMLGIKGFSLVEVLVAITVLTITIVSFTFVYGWSFENIFLMGEKSTAVAKAQNALERMYININDDKIDLQRVISPDDLYTYSESGNYYVEENVTYTLEEDEDVVGNKVTVVVFYKNGERHVSLSAFILNE